MFYTNGALTDAKVVSKGDLSWRKQSQAGVAVEMAKRARKEQRKLAQVCVALSVGL